MNEEIRKIEVIRAEKYTVSTKALRQTLNDVNGVITALTYKLNQLKKEPEPSDSKIEQIKQTEKTFRLFNDYLQIINAFRKLGDKPVPPTWKELMGDPLYDTEPIQLPIKEGGKWKLAEIEPGETSKILKLVSWATEIPVDARELRLSRQANKIDVVSSTDSPDDTVESEPEPQSLEPKNNPYDGVTFGKKK